MGARDRSAGNLSLKKPPKTVRHRFTFPIRASDSCRKLLTAEVWTIRARTAVLESCTVSFNGRDRPTNKRLVYGKRRPTRMLGSFLPFSFPEKWEVQKKRKSGKYKSVKRGESVKEYSIKRGTFHFIQSLLSFHSPRRVELNTSCWTFHSIHLSSRVLYRLCLVCIEFCWRHVHWLNVNWTLLILYKVFLFILFISRVQSLWKTALT